MILIQLGRLIVGLIFKHEKTDYGNRSLNIEFFNVSTEALFNLAILYYFIQNQKSEPEIQQYKERSLSQLDELKKNFDLNPQ